MRELKNVIERAMILKDQGYIDVDLLPLRISEFAEEPAGFPGNGMLSIPAQGINLYNVEKELIRQALIKARGNQTKASRLLSISRDTLRYKMKKYRLSKHRESIPLETQD